MPNTFFGLTIGASGLNASNAAINTVAHNVSNINTKGYTKQSTKQVANFGIKVYKPYGAVGTGVTVTDIVQARSEYYDSRYRQNNTQVGQYETLDTYSSLVQNYLDEFNLDGFITEYNNLFKTVDGLTGEPSSEVKRGQFLSYMSSICEYFNTLSTNLQNTQNNINTELKSSISSVNTIAEQIASLNKQINTIEANGGTANDLRDARNLLIDDLSAYADVEVVERDKGNGVTDCTILFNSQALVEGYNYNSLECVARESGRKRNASDAEGLYDVRWTTGMPYNPYEETAGGSIKALFDMRDGCNDAYERVTVAAGGTKSLEVVPDAYRNPSHKGIPYYQSQLNRFLTVFAEEFNNIILKGQTQDGQQCTTPLLTSKYNDDYVTAANICVNQEFLNDLSKLPYSYAVSKGQENPDMARDLYALKEKVTIKSGTFWEFLSSIVSEVSVDTMRAETFSKNYNNIKGAVETQRASISGVDEDEEGIDLVKFQHAYDLSSKIISVMNQIYSKLIEETGL